MTLEPAETSRFKTPESAEKKINFLPISNRNDPVLPETDRISPQTDKKRSVIHAKWQASLTRPVATRRMTLGTIHG